MTHLNRELTYSRLSRCMECGTGATWGPSGVYLLDNELLQVGLQGVRLVQQGRAGLCLHLKGTHLGGILPHHWVVALQVVMLGLWNQGTSARLYDGKLSCLHYISIVGMGRVGHHGVFLNSVAIS